jgi:hypothetical protein
MCILGGLGRFHLGRRSDLRRYPKPLAAVPTLLACALLCAACTGYGKPNVSSTELAFGVDMARRGLWSEALFRFHAAEQADPENPRVQNDLGVAYEAQGDFDKALDHYKRALQLAPDNREVRANYARFVEYYQSFKAPDKAAKQGKTGTGSASSSPASPLTQPGAQPLPSPAPPLAPRGPGEPSNVPPGPGGTSGPQPPAAKPPGQLPPPPPAAPQSVPPPGTPMPAAATPGL